MGSNEVPKAKGGTYWCDEQHHDAREYKKNEDSNDTRKREILNEIFQEAQSNISFEQFIQKKSVQDSQFMDALEYGRIVHAEMSALSDAARLGYPVKDSILYCTTFPCHMCAKHIVASGIKEVVFLEPYPKSLASDLHSDSIQIEGASRGQYLSYEAVKFEHFHGVTPRRYRELFERNSRKSNGIYQKYINGKKKPNITIIAPTYIEYEKSIVAAGLEAYEHLRMQRSK
jgi:deoxycytidylate deaminase